MSSNICPDCQSASIEYDTSAGNYSCSVCGRVTVDVHMTSELGFVEGTTGGASVVGQFVARDGRTVSGAGVQGGQYRREAREMTTAKAKKSIASTIAALVQNTGISPGTPLITVASQIFSTALVEGHVRGRRSEHVYAACIYIAAVRGYEPYLLIDLAQATECNLYEIGECATQISQRLSLKLSPNDPSSYVHRFALRLNLGETTHRVARDAIKLIQLMKRDWIAIGRRVNGLCAAALLLSARAHGFKPELDDLSYIFKVSTQTIKSRLADISNSSHSDLTLTDLRIHFGTAEEIQEARTTTVINEDGIEINVVNDFPAVPLNFSADPPSFQRGIIQRTRVNQWRQLFSAKHDIALLLIHTTTLFTMALKSQQDPIQLALALSDHDFSKLLDQIYTEIRSIDQWCKATTSTREQINEFFFLYDFAAYNTVSQYCIDDIDMNTRKSAQKRQIIQDIDIDLDLDLDLDHHDNWSDTDEDHQDLDDTLSTTRSDKKNKNKQAIQKTKTPLKTTKKTKSTKKGSKDNKSTSLITTTTSNSNSSNINDQTPEYQLHDKNQVISALSSLFQIHDIEYQQWLDWLLTDAVSDEFSLSQQQFQDAFKLKHGNLFYSPPLPTDADHDMNDIDTGSSNNSIENDKNGIKLTPQSIDNLQDGDSSLFSESSEDEDDIFGSKTFNKIHKQVQITPILDTPATTVSDMILVETSNDILDNQTAVIITPDPAVPLNLQDNEDYIKFCQALMLNEEKQHKVVESLQEYYQTLSFSKNLFYLTTLTPQFRRTLLNSVSDDHDVDDYDHLLQKIFDEEFLVRYGHLSGFPISLQDDDVDQIFDRNTRNFIQNATTCLPDGFPEPTLGDFILFSTNAPILKPLLEIRAYGLNEIENVIIGDDGVPLPIRIDPAIKAAALNTAHGLTALRLGSLGVEHGVNKTPQNVNQPITDNSKHKKKSKKTLKKQVDEFITDTDIKIHTKGTQSVNGRTVKVEETEQDEEIGHIPSKEIETNKDQLDQIQPSRAPTSSAALVENTTTSTTLTTSHFISTDQNDTTELQRQRVIDDETKSIFRVTTIINHLHYLFLLQYHQHINEYTLLRQSSSTTTTTTTTTAPHRSSRCLDLMVSLQSKNPADLFDGDIFTAILDALTLKTRSLLTHTLQQDRTGGNLLQQTLTRQTTPSSMDLNSYSQKNLNNELLEHSPSLSTALVEVNNALIDVPEAKKSFFLPVPRLHDVFKLDHTYRALQGELEAIREVEFTTLLATATTEIHAWIEERKKGTDPQIFCQDIDEDELDTLILSPEEQEQRLVIWEQVIQRIHGVSRQHKEHTAEYGEGRKRARQLRLAEEEKRKQVNLSALFDDDDVVNMTDGYITDQRDGLLSGLDDESLFSEDPLTDCFSKSFSHNTNTISLDTPLSYITPHQNTTTDFDNDDDEFGVFVKPSAWDPVSTTTNGKEPLKHLNAIYNTLDPGNTTVKHKLPPTSITEDEQLYGESDNNTKRQRIIAPTKPPQRRG